MEINKYTQQILFKAGRLRGKLVISNGSSYYSMNKNNYYINPIIILLDHLSNGTGKYGICGERLYVGNDLYDMTVKDENLINIFVAASDLWRKNFLRIPDFENRKWNLSNSLSKVKWNDKGIPKKLRLNKEWSQRISSHEVVKLKVGLDLFNDPEPEEGLLEAWLEGLRGERKHTHTMIHFPMIMCEETVDETLTVPILPNTTVQAKIFDSCKWNMTHSTYQKLSDKPPAKKVSPKIDKGDHCHPKLDKALRKQLAARGVQAKTFLSNSKAEVVKPCKSIDKDFDTDVLEEYLSSSFVFGDERDASSEYEIDINNGTGFVNDWFNLVSRIEEFKCLEFHDRVISEVIANSTRNIDHDCFIVRKIVGYQACIIIKTTSLGSVHDPKPIYYSIAFKGRSLESNGVFEKVHDGDCGWKYTDFLSTSRIRSSHQMNMMPQFQMMIYENIETLRTLTETPSEEMINDVSETIKWCMCVHMQDREEFSAAASNYRYYYFSLFSGFNNCKVEAEQLAKKLPCVIRDPLHLLAIRKLVRIHSNLDSDQISQATSVLSFKSLKETIDVEDPNVEDAEYDKLPTIETPFGFDIDNARTFLKASYMSIYHDKDEAEKGPAAKQIVSKMCKQEKHMTELLKSDMDPDSWEEDIGKDLGIYRFNARGCIFGADLVKKMLLSQRGLSENSYQANSGYDEWIEETVITPCVLRTTYDILASTSSSYVDNGEVSVSEYGKQRRISKKRKREYNSAKKDEVLIGKTVKCIEAIMQMRKDGQIEGMSVSDDLGSFLFEFAKNGSRMVIKIFKKNQLTGVREIYILTMVGRALQRLVEDLARSVCKEINEEKLTSPETKDSFIPEHKSECKSLSEGRPSITINGSGDKTQWANYLHAKLISLPLFRILPEKYHRIVAHVYNANTKKEIEIPQSLMDSFLKHPDTDLEDPVLNEVKAAVLSGRESELCKKDSSRIRCKGNTMQGIGHYSSSLLHLCALALLKALLTKYLISKGYDSCVNFEVSSDDKGFMVTVFVSKEINLNKIVLTIKITQYLRYLERVIDSCFGIRDSRLKSVTTISVSFEFNSVFYFGNSITTPLAKFTARCCDDSIQSTLHNRVSSFFSSCRQIRDNGGSGILCSLATLCQHIVMKCNLGFKTFAWFDKYASIDYNKYKFSHLGYRRICNPITAGLCMSDYENIKHANQFKLGRQYRSLMRRDIDSEDLPDQIHLTVSLWKRDKHEAMLKRLEVNNKELTKEDSLMILSSPVNAEEMSRKLKLMVMSTGLSRSMVMCQRSDLLRAGMYLLWHNAFRIDDRKIPYQGLIDHLSDMGNEDFEVSEEYKDYIQLEKDKRFYINRDRRMRLMPRQYKPLVSHSFVRDDVITYLRKKWLDQGEFPEQFIVDQILSECVWIKKTSKKFFDNYEPSMLHRFINMIPTRKTKTKLLARGNTHGMNIVRCLMRNNTSSDQDMLTTGDAADPLVSAEARNFIRGSCGRISLWVDLLFASGNDNHISIAAIDDLTKTSEGYKRHYKDHCQAKQERLAMYVLQCLKEKSEIDTMDFYLLGSNDYVDFYDAHDPGGKYEYSTHSGCAVISRRERRTGRITDYKCGNPRVSSNISNFKQYSHASSDRIPIRIRIKIRTIRQFNGCLEIGDGRYTIGGLVGKPQDSPSDIGFHIGDGLFSKVDKSILEKICCNHSQFVDLEMDRIMMLEGVVPKAVRSLIYHHGKSADHPPFTSSSNVQTDLDKKSVSKQDRETSDKTLKMSWNDMNNLLEIEDEPIVDEELVLDGVGINIDAYFENNEDTCPELYSGVVRLEIDRKSAIDRIFCIKIMDKFIEKGLKLGRTWLTSAVWTLWELILEENFIPEQE